MRAIYALYSSPESAQRAVDGLRAAGIADREITIMSSEPLEGYEFGRRDQATWMPWIAGLGGLIGISSAYWLTSTTQMLWPLDTGGMPIVTMWPNLIVMFELTMLGAILATFITLLVTARIPRRQPELYDPGISDDQILVGIANPPEPAFKDIEKALRASGAADLKRIS